MIPEDPWYQSFVQSSDNLHQVQGVFQAEIASIFGNGGQAGGGNFAFNPDQLVSIHKQWADLKTTVEQALSTNAAQLTKVPPPGNEQASDTAANAITASNTAYQNYLKSMHDYIEGYVKSLETAITGYHGTEQSIIDAARQIQSQQQA